MLKFLIRIIASQMLQMLRLGKLHRLFDEALASVHLRPSPSSEAC